MKRKSQSRSEHQKTAAEAAKDPDALKKMQPSHASNGSPWGDQPAVPSTAVEFSFKGAALLRLYKDEKGATIVRTLGGNQKMNVVTESGLYHLVLTSQKPGAKVFRHWVTRTVLPSIRQTGGYHSNDDARTARARGDARQDAVTVVLPGPGRYVATVVPDGAVHAHETEYQAVLDEMTLTDCRILCHTLKIIEGQWHRFQRRRSVASDRPDEVGLARLEAAILDGSRLADRSLMWHSSFEE